MLTSFHVWMLAARVAVAAEGQSGLLAPGAEPMAAGEGSIGLGAAAGALAFVGSAGAALVEASYAPTDRVAVGGAIAHATFAVATPLGGVYARGSAFDAPWLRVAPWAWAAGARGATGPGGAAGLGLAVEGGGDRLRFDLSAPVLALWREPTLGEWGAQGPMLLGEAGVSWHFGEARRHRVRLGVPALSWRFRGDEVYAEAGVSALLWVAAFGRAGIRF